MAIKRTYQIYSCAERPGALQHFLSHKRKKLKLSNWWGRQKKLYFFQEWNWKVAKSELRKTAALPISRFGERVVENDLDQATMLNNYFCPCFDQSAHLRIIWHLNVWHYQSTSVSFLSTESEIFEMLLSLDTKRANGWNGTNTLHRPGDLSWDHLLDKYTPGCIIHANMHQQLLLLLGSTFHSLLLVNCSLLKDSTKCHMLYC